MNHNTVPFTLGGTLQFTLTELAAAFARIQNAEHWKGAIDAVIEEKDRDVTACAVEFYTATRATFAPVKDVMGVLRVRAAGYWAGPAN